MGRIPVNIITGFLGAGKTTAIIHLLNHLSIAERWALIINEFGKIPIDSKMLYSNSVAGDIYTITGGCICCSVKECLNDNLIRIINSNQYSRIIIEPSGLGGIETVSEIVRTHESLQRKPIICLVDISGMDILRLQMNPIYRMQIINSDVILFSKIDLATSESILNGWIQKFMSAFPNARVYEGSNLDIHLLEMDLNNIKENNPLSGFRLLNESLLSTNYVQIYRHFRAETIFDTQKLYQSLRKIPSILRAKGMLHTTNGWVLLNFTLTNYEIATCREFEQNEMVIIADDKQPNITEIIDHELAQAIHNLE